MRAGLAVMLLGSALLARDEKLWAEGEVLWKRGQALMAAKKPREARACFEKAAVLYDKAKAIPDAAYIHGFIADACVAMEDYESAVRHYLVSSDRHGAIGGKDHRIWAVRQRCRAGEILRMTLERSEDALKAVQGALRFVREGETRTEWDTQLNLAQTTLVLGQIEEAEGHVARAREVWKKIRPHANPLIVQLDACIARAKGDYEQARTLLRKAVEVCGRPEWRHRGDLLVNALKLLGDFCRHHGRFVEAFDASQRALDAARRVYGENHLRVGTCHLSVAESLQQLARYHEAGRHARAALEILSDAFDGDHAGKGLALLTAGECLWREGKIREGMAKLRQSQAMLDRLDEDSQSGRALHQVAICEQMLGNRDEAIRLYELAATKALGKMKANYLSNLAILYRDSGEKEKALAAALRALEAQRSIYALKTAASIRLIRAEPREAIALMEEAIPLVESQRSTYAGLGVVDFSSLFRVQGKQVYENIAGAYHQLGNYERAVDHDERARGRSLVELLSRAGEDSIDESLAASAEGKKLLARLKASRKSIASSSYLLRTYKGRDETFREDLKTKLDRAQAEERTILRLRAALIRDVVPATRSASAAELQAMLRDDEYLLAFSIYGTMWLVPPKGRKIEAFRVRREVWSRVESCLPGRVRGGTDRGMKPANAKSPDTGGTASQHGVFRLLVHQDAWRKIRKANRVYILPQGPLRNIPFELLTVDEKGTTWLDAGPPISYAPSGTFLKWCIDRSDARESKASPLDLVALGAPDFGDRELVALPGTKREIDAAAAVFQRDRVRRLFGSGATEALLFAEAPKARFVHVASHAVVERGDRAMLSSLELARPAKPTPDDDGSLRLSDLLTTWGGKLGHCELVVLSACETQRGADLGYDQTLALPIGFFYAGAPAVIASLWRVDDESTAELFADFYKRLAKGTPKLQAFTEARKALKKKYPDPYHWAAFVYMGDPR